MSPLNLNLSLYRLLSAGWTPNPWVLQAATLLATQSSWLCIAAASCAAARHRSSAMHVLAALLASGIASGVAQSLAEFIGSPRPFMLGLGPAYIAHGERGGLPSTHASATFALAFTLLLERPLRRCGGVVACIALATGWARIYVGVHFPLDVGAGMLLAAAVALALWAVRQALRQAASAQALAARM